LTDTAEVEEIYNLPVTGRIVHPSPKRRDMLLDMPLRPRITPATTLAHDNARVSEMDCGGSLFAEGHFSRHTSEKGVPGFRAFDASENTSDFSSEGDDKLGLGDSDLFFEPGDGGSGEFFETFPMVAGRDLPAESLVLFPVARFEEKDFNEVGDPAQGTGDLEGFQVELLELVCRGLGSDTGAVKVPLGF
jgi:hypothetical protein